MQCIPRLGVAFVAVVLGCASGDDIPADEPLATDESALVHGGFELPTGGVLDGWSQGNHLECSMCSGAQACSASCTEANGDASTCGLAGPTCAAARSNIAASSALSTAVASSTYSSATPASSLINGDRRGLTWASGGGWSDASANLYPDSVEVRFYTGSGTRPIHEVDVYTLQDACGSAPSASTCVEPTDAMTFASWGVTDYRLQAWNGSAFVDIPNAAATANHQVVRRFELSPPVVTTKLRVLVTGALAGFSRLVEIEAWEERSANDPYLAQAINNRIAMSGATGCETTPHTTTINGVTGSYKHCNYAWVVASPGNGAWFLPQSYISNTYLGGTTWPATPTATMSALGFPRGAYHGSDATDNYVVFERGILAKSSSHATPRRIGGLTAATGGVRFASANAALTAAWLGATFADKYPVTDTVPWVCYGSLCSNTTVFSNYGFRFTTEANAWGYDSTFFHQDGSSGAFHLDGEIENKWKALPASTMTSLGWPIANETRIAANGSAVSQFTGGSIVWKSTTCNGTTFAAYVNTAVNGQPTPIYAGGPVGLTCGEVAQVCSDGAQTPFTSPSGISGTYQFLCNAEDVYGWWSTLRFRWQTASGTVNRYVRPPIMRRYLSSDPTVYGSAGVSVATAIATFGLPLGSASSTATETRQEFEGGTIVDARMCFNACTETTACDVACTHDDQRITCGEYTPSGFERGKCQLYDIYCELPEVTDVRVGDNSEIPIPKLGGPVAFFYYRQPGGGPEKRGVMPVQIGGVGGAEASEYLERIWTAGRPNIASTPDLFPYASNLPGPWPESEAGTNVLQLEFEAGPIPETALPHPALEALTCVTLAHPSYGEHPPTPTFPESTLVHVYEDDECLDVVVGTVCNPDDYIGSIRFYHGRCAAQHWDQGDDFGFTSPRTLTSTSPSGSPDLGGPMNNGSYYLDDLHYRDWCYRGMNLQRGTPRAIQSWQYGIGTQEHNSFGQP